MGYCDGLCKYLNEKKHKCEKTGEKLTYIKWSGAGAISCIAHEHRGFCEEAKE